MLRRPTRVFRSIYREVVSGRWGVRLGDQAPTTHPPFVAVRRRSRAALFYRRPTPWNSVPVSQGVLVLPELVTPSRIRTDVPGPDGPESLSTRRWESHLYAPGSDWYRLSPSRQLGALIQNAIPALLLVPRDGFSPPTSGPFDRCSKSCATAAYSLEPGAGLEPATSLSTRALFL